MNTTLSELVNNIPPSATFAVSLYVQKLKSEGKEIINLGVGEPDFITPQYIQDATKDAIDSHKYFTYPPASGYTILREEISKKLKKDNKLNYDPNQIVISPGAKQALSISCLSIINPGDEVIVFTPYWVSYESTVLIARGTPVFVCGTKENGYKVTADQLKKAITPKTKGIIFSSPCNPTGAVFSESELQKITDVLDDHKDIIVISDEIYEYINFGSEPHFSIGSIQKMEEKTITINGFSKAYAMTGWRLGYMAAPIEIASACAKLQGQFASGICGIVQMAGVAALRGGKPKIQYMVDEYKKRRDFLVDEFKNIPGFELPFPDGAFYLFPDISYYFGKKYDDIIIKTANDFCKFLISKASVALVTGGAFGCPSCVRISYAASLENLEKAIKNIKGALNLLN